MSEEKKVALPGIEILGKAYDVTGRYANALSIQEDKADLFEFDFSSFNPDSDPSVPLRDLWGRDYYHPDEIFVTGLRMSAWEKQKTRTFETMAQSFEQSSQVRGMYEGFYGSFKEAYEKEYLSSESYFSVLQKGEIQAYSASLPPLVELRKRMTEDAQRAINGDLATDKVIQVFGTHFMYSGIFGGTIDYAQCALKYQEATSEQAEASVYANYMGFISGSTSASGGSDSYESGEFSSAHWECKGGSPDQVDNWDDWAAGVMDGQFTLVDFKENASLQPLSVLASSKERRDELNAAIADKLRSEPQSQFQLAVDYDSAYPYQAAEQRGSEREVITEEGSNDIIVGVAVNLSDKGNDVLGLAVKVLNLESNSERWVFAEDSSENQNDYDMVLEISEDTGHRGVAMTGFEIAERKKNIVMMKAWYQILNPATSPVCMATGAPKYDAKGDNDYFNDPQVGYKPLDNDAGYAIIGLGLSASDNEFKALNLTLAKLKLIEEEPWETVN